MQTLQTGPDTKKDKSLVTPPIQAPPPVTYERDPSVGVSVAMPSPVPELPDREGNHSSPSLTVSIHHS